MALPPSLISAVESHGCFSGCYTHELPIQVVTDPNRPTSTVFSASCQDCLMYNVGGLVSVLPAGMSQYNLAQELSAHARKVRGFRWALAGYHATGNGFWLSAVYYGNGLFIVDASRNSGGARDCDMLVQAFQSKLIPIDEVGMLDPSKYASEVVYLSYSSQLTGVTSKSDILRYNQCSLSPRQGLRRAVILEYLPLIKSTSTSTSNSSVAKQSVTPATVSVPAPVFNAVVQANLSWTAKDIGKTCLICKKEVAERQLFVGSFIGCMC